jgi:hypothetical protein
MSTVNIEGKGMWKAEIDLDVADNIAVQSLIRSHQTMVECLEDYKVHDHRWIAVFDTNEEEDIKQLKKMRDALALVINHWYGGKVDEATEVIVGECGVNLLRENEDGSADYQFNFPPEALEALTRLGILTALKAGIADAQKLDPKFNQAFTDEIRELAEEAGFATWQEEGWNTDNNVVDWANQYDKELVKFYHLVKEKA